MRLTFKEGNFSGETLANLSLVPNKDGRHLLQCYNKDSDIYFSLTISNKEARELEKFSKHLENAFEGKGESELWQKNTKNIKSIIDPNDLYNAIADNYKVREFIKLIMPETKIYYNITDEIKTANYPAYRAAIALDFPYVMPKTLLEYLPAGKTYDIEGYIGNNKIVYQFLKNPHWNGERDHSKNAVKVTAFYEGEPLCTIASKEPVPSEDFALYKYTCGASNPEGDLLWSPCNSTWRPTNPIEELRQKGIPLDLSNAEIVNVIINETDYFIEAAGPNKCRVAPVEFEENDAYCSTAREIYERVQDDFNDRVLRDLAEEAEYYEIGFKGETEKEWADFFLANDTYKTFMENPKTYDFVQWHRLELEMCNVVAYHLDEISAKDVLQVYETETKNAEKIKRELMEMENDY